jgi:hypothetical protein
MKSRTESEQRLAFGIQCATSSGLVPVMRPNALRLFSACCSAPSPGSLLGHCRLWACRKPLINHRHLPCAFPRLCSASLTDPSVAAAALGAPITVFCRLWVLI